MLENALDHARADTKLSADLENPVTLGLQFQYSRFHGWLYSTTTEFDSLRPGTRQASIDSFSDNSPLELGKYAQHLKHRLPGSS